ncbi:MAG: cupin domain-containing protein [Chthoniobacterales bacterium]
MKRVILSVVAVGALAGTAASLRAQDAVKVDAKHYTVAFENDQVRVLKAHYAPGEKSTMHSHPQGLAVFLTDAKGKFTFPDGKSEDFNGKAGDVIWNKPTVHLPENIGDQPFEVIVVELKGKHSAKK